VNANSYVSATGTWYGNSSSNSWGVDLHVGNVGYMYSDTLGVNTSSTQEVIYAFPTGYIGGSAFLNHFPWSVNGYFDVYVCKSSNSAQEVFCCRIGNCNDVNNAGHGGNYDGVRVDCVASGMSSYDQIKIKCRKGRIMIMGWGFSLEVDRPVTPNSLVHSDNIVGDPAALSDSRLKSDQSVVPGDKLTSIFNAIEAKEYDLHRGTDIDGEELPKERRVGFIADDVQAAIDGTEWSNIVSSKMKNGEDYLTLDYSRLVCVLWGHVKALTARVSTLEATVDALAA
jgi:hypothetical protein